MQPSVISHDRWGGGGGGGGGMGDLSTLKAQFGLRLHFLFISNAFDNDIYFNFASKTTDDWSIFLRQW